MNGGDTFQCRPLSGTNVVDTGYSRQFLGETGFQNNEGTVRAWDKRVIKVLICETTGADEIIGIANAWTEAGHEFERVRGGKVDVKIACWDNFSTQYIQGSQIDIRYPSHVIYIPNRRVVSKHVRGDADAEAMWKNIILHGACLFTHPDFANQLSSFWTYHWVWSHRPTRT